MATDFSELFQQSWIVILTYFPLGVIGLWRWGVWLIKKIYAVQYRPQAGSGAGTVAVITPVYNEDPDIFRRALASWRENGVEEIVAVIDYTDNTCISIFEEFSRTFPGGKLVVTKKPGKRPALVDGIQVATTEFVALVDSDTIWGEQVKQSALVPFRNPKIGGVATRQSVLKPVTFAQRLFNAQLNLRYLEEMPFMVARGGVAVTCLSGRTAFYRRQAVLPLLDALLHETFWGKPVISGDDKRLTYLLEGAGWHVAFQQNAHVYTPGMPTMKAFLKQRLRWTRNSWRADLRTLTQPWVYRHPRFAVYLIDRALQPFAQLLSPVFFVVSLALGLYIPALVLFVWWHLGRTIRMWSYLRRAPREVLLVPAFVIFNFYAALMKVYALITLNRQGWITRWDKNRLPGAPALLRLATAYGVTVVVLTCLAAGVTLHERTVLAALRDEAAAVALQPLANAPALLPPVEFFGASPIARYVVQRGDTLEDLADRWGVTVSDIVRVNAVRLPSRDYFEAGLVLDQPSAHHAAITADYATAYEELGPLRITYVPETNTIEVRGRGQQVTPYDIAQKVDRQQLHESPQGVWHLGANLNIKAGVTLNLLPPEVSWLQLKSDAQSQVAITIESGVASFTGVKITSWDSSANQVDEDYLDGRSYIIAKGNSRLDIVESELAYLGEPVPAGGPSATYGVAWLLADEERGKSLISGEVRRSRFHHNYDGVYVSGGTGLQFIENQLYENVRYGLDLYGSSRDSVLIGNDVHHNGLHGIILAHDSVRNEVRGNRVYANSRHGIVVHERSIGNLITDNTVYGQADGMAVNGSRGNVFTHNTVYENERGVRFTGSRGNVFADNEVRDSGNYGIYVDENSPENIVRGNTVAHNPVGVYVRSVRNDILNNHVQENGRGVSVLKPAHDNRLQGNTLRANTKAGVYLKTNAPNYAGENVFEQNALDVSAL